jgi:phosphoenolpyruvate carboxykinase (ATP)
LEDIAISYVNSRNKIFIVDGYAGYDVNHRMKFRILTTRAYHAIFMKNMLITPNE